MVWLKILPGLLIYRFGAPLLFFNAPYLVTCVQKIIDEATPPVTFLLLNTEAVVEIDWEAVKALGELQYSLKTKASSWEFANPKVILRRP